MLEGDDLHIVLVEQRVPVLTLGMARSLRVQSFCAPTLIVWGSFV